MHPARVLWIGALLATCLSGQEANIPFTAAAIVGDESTNFRAVIDIDGDGDRDAVGASLGTSVFVTAWKNDGSGSFTKVSSSTLPPNGATFLHVGVGDFNADGLGDLVMSVGSLLTWWLGTPSGFGASPTWSSPEVSEILGLAVADFDGDGRDDVAVSRSGELKILRSHATNSPTFMSNALLPFDGQHDILATDINADGQSDVAIAVHSLAAAGVTRVIMIPIIGGVIGTPVSEMFPGTYFPIKLAAGDIDKDLDEDLVVFGPISYSVLRRVGPSTFTKEAFRPGGPATHLFDVDGDGDLDGVCCAGGGGGQPAATTESYFELALNDGTGNFSHSFKITSLDGARLATAEDLDGDGDVELVGGRCIHYGTGGQSAPPYTNVFPVLNSRELLDHDGDGDVDFAFRINTVVRNRGNGTFSDISHVAPAPPAFPAGAVFEGPGIPGDFDGDGDVDLLVKVKAQGVFQQMRLLANTGGGGLKDGGPAGPTNVDFCFMPVNNETFAADTAHSLVSDLDGDGDQDLVTSTLVGHSRVWWNQGGATFVSGPVFTSRLVIKAVDFNGDGTVDLLATASNGLYIIPGLPGGNFGTSQILLPLSNNTELPGIGDVDGDGDLDVVIHAVNLPTLYLNDGSGGLTQAATFPEATAPLVQSTLYPRRIFIQDVNGDGHNDIVVTPLNKATYACHIAFNSGNGTFNVSVQQTLSPIAFADVDGDGDVDALEYLRVAPNRRFQGPSGGIRYQYGQDLAGTGGMAPNLGDIGPFRPGVSGELVVTGGLGGAPAIMVLSNTPTTTPIAGGILHMTPDILWPFNLNGAPGAAGEGSYRIPWTLTAPAAGLTIYHQVGVADPGAPQGVSMSQALMVRIGN